MAARESLGARTPVGLQYLIAEGLLPKTSGPNDYSWETYVSDGENEDFEEEVLSTKNAVVWSQGQFVRNVYRFHLEGEDVVQAILTSFSNRSTSAGRGETLMNQDQDYGTSPGLSMFFRKTPEEDQDRTNLDLTARALVVILKTKAHIYFLQGPSHIIDLPFEIERAFPAPRGLVLQRKPSQPLSSLLTPSLLVAPPNSFISSQPLQSSYSAPSPAQNKSLASVEPSRSNSFNKNPRLENLFQDVARNSNNAGDEEFAKLYTLTGPIADFGVVMYSIPKQKHRLSGKAKTGLTVEFEPLEAAEELIYMSSRDELPSNTNQLSPFILLATLNSEIGTMTLWHAWYINEQSLQIIIKQRAERKAAKARRRSSFMSTKAGTGAATPTVRPREGTRESFAAGGSVRVHPETITSQHHGHSSRKLTRQQEEDVMASQMDPDYQPSGSQQLGRDNRRISSMNADERAGHSAINASFGGTGGRRHTSFGGLNDRRSLRQRKSRGSTPGSVFSRSLDADEDMMELDSTNEFEDEENLDTILRYIRATFETSGVDSLFGSTGENFKRELVVRKIHSFLVQGPITTNGSQESQTRAFKMVTLPASPISPDADSGKLNVYFHERRTKDVRCMELEVRHRRLWPESKDTITIPIPLFKNQRTVDRYDDIQKFQHGRNKAILLGNDSILFPLDVISQRSMPVELSNGAPDLPDMFTMYSEGSVAHGISGNVDGIRHGRDIHHKRPQICPQEPYVDRLLHLCEAVLPKQQSEVVRPTWCMAHVWFREHHEHRAATSSSLEFVALVTTIFMFALGLLDSKARASLKISTIAARTHNAPTNNARQLQKEQHQHEIFSRPAWAWMIPGHESNVQGRPQSGSKHQDRLLIIAAASADQLSSSSIPSLRQKQAFSASSTVIARLMLALHVFCEEQKLCTLLPSLSRRSSLAPVVAQLGNWLGLTDWGSGDGKYYNIEAAEEDRWTYIRSTSKQTPHMNLMEQPLGVFEWFEHALKHGFSERYPSLLSIAQMSSEEPITEERGEQIRNITPNISALSDLTEKTNGLTASPSDTVEYMAKLNITGGKLDAFPESIAAPLREAISQCETSPPTTWSKELLRLVSRDELTMTAADTEVSSTSISPYAHATVTVRDTQTICHALDQPHPNTRTKEASRHAVSQLIFSEDRRLVEATSLMHFNSIQVAECPKQPDWTEAFHFEQQRKVMQWVTIRMIALPSGDGMIHFDSQTPLLTEKYPLPGFTSSCLMQPMGHTLTTDRSGLTEEKVNWAYFHAGVSSGLRISHGMKGIDTSWVAFNKPTDLTNRHAGLLLALGLGGHLYGLAKWLSFKYLTPKHTMTSIGLLLGLSASYIGTMDGLITRMLSVHITRMLPPGAAELNVSSTTQTAGLMGIGLLYYNTQHRRMSEIMLSEIEHMDILDPDIGPDMLRDESYRLAAGFALGFINLGKGEKLRGLHGLRLPERLLAIAVGPRPVNAVHVFDRATAGAVIALALIFMKSGNQAIARKIDIPDTEAQFDHVRPDMLLLRAMTKHVILWDDINAGEPESPGWIQENLPACYKTRSKQVMKHMVANRTISSAHIPLFNVYTGLAWALALKYAGSGNEVARDEILNLLKFFYGLSDGTDAYYYDGKLGRFALRRCMDVLALSAAMIMAGTGDIQTFRYLRRMHGRTDADTPYGSHLASHMAIGTLFLAGGTATFGTSDLAIASLICAFYPLFPTEVQDNNVHLQAFRHLWVLAAEARCIVVEDIDIHHPIHMPIKLIMKDGSTRSVRSPCLLPELDTVATIQTDDPAYWRVTLDFVGNPTHLAAFRKDQRCFVRRCPAAESHTSVFTAALAALNSTVYDQAKDQKLWHSLFSLSAFKDLDQAEIELALSPDVNSSARANERATSIDDRLVLTKAVTSTDRDQLWNLRILFSWAQRTANEGNYKLNWLGREFVEALKAKVEVRTRELASKS